MHLFYLETSKFREISCTVITKVCFLGYFYFIFCFPFCVGLICIDEAQYIKNSKSQTTQALKKLRAPLRVALSGTPVENNLAELWSVFDFVLPKYLENLKDFKASYSKPIEVRVFRRTRPVYLQILR